MNIDVIGILAGKQRMIYYEPGIFSDNHKNFDL